MSLERFVWKGMNSEAFEIKKFWQEYQAAVLRQGIPKAKAVQSPVDA
jgi:hypothetical protein